MSLIVQPRCPSPDVLWISYFYSFFFCLSEVHPFESQLFFKLVFFLFFFNQTAPTEIYTLSLPDALPISPLTPLSVLAFSTPYGKNWSRVTPQATLTFTPTDEFMAYATVSWGVKVNVACGVTRDQFLRSEEHTSELQSLRHLLCRLLLGKK